MDRRAAEAWIGARVTPVAAVETLHERPWATVLRVPTAGGNVWFKHCAPQTRFEPALTAALSARWPDRVAVVIAHDEGRGWLLLADAGTPIGVYGNPPEAWLAVLPAYAELQLGEVQHVPEHLAHGVPDLRLAALPARFDELAGSDLPLDADELESLRRLAPRFATLCDELAARGVPASIQHDDLHHTNVYAQGGRLRVLDWGDACVSHPFASLVVTFQFLEEITRLQPGDPWYARLRDAYLEPWGRPAELADTFALALAVGTFAHAFAWARQREHLPGRGAGGFDTAYAALLRRATAAVASPASS